MSLGPGTVPLVVAFIALFVGVLGAVVSATGIVQRQRADRRTALRDRCKVALAMSQSADPSERLIGTDMISLLLDQAELSPNDAALLGLAGRGALRDGDVDGAGEDEVAAMSVVSPVESAFHDPLDNRPRQAHDDDDPGDET